MRQEMVDIARSYLGVPFVHLGRSKKGVDCVGLLYVAFNPFLNIPDPQDYGKSVLTIKSFSKVREYAHRITIDEVEPADIVLMSNNKNSAHYGLVTGNTVIHADQLMGRVVEHNLKSLIDGKSRRRAVAFFRMEGVI